MPVSSYPRVTVQGTGASQNPQNGQALMILNPSTNKYEAATSSTFAGGGGGATAANQTTQITEAQDTNTKLDTSNSNTTIIANRLYDNGAGLSAAELLEFIRLYLFNNSASESIAELCYNSSTGKSIATLLEDIRLLLVDIKDNQTNNTQVTQIVGDGNIAYVTSSNELKTA